METIKVEVLYEEFVFRGAFALPVEESEVDSLIVLFCAILKTGFLVQWNISLRETIIEK
jgi:hypothetical protein